MSGIIELWRKNYDLNLPVTFTVGQQPAMEDGSVMADSPTVSKIEYRETGSLSGKRMNEPLFVISFDESLVQRFVKANDAIDIAYETTKNQDVKVPDLEE